MKILLLLFVPLIPLLAACTVQVQEPMTVRVVNPIQAEVVNWPKEEAGSGMVGMNQPTDTPTSFSAVVRQIAEQLNKSLKSKGIKRLPIAVAPFVDLENSKNPHPLGKQLSEHFFHELQIRGYNLIDDRAISFPRLKANDALLLSDYYKRHRISYVLSGTYSVTPDGASIHARMLDTVTRQVAATGQGLLLNEVLEGQLPGYNPLSSSNGMIIENGGIPDR
jgi:TolB-like protein